MSLKLTKPPAEVDAPPELTLAEFEALRARRDAYLDRRIAEEKRKLPDLPSEVLRMCLLRGQDAWAAVERLLREPESQ